MILLSLCNRFLQKITICNYWRFYVMKIVAICNRIPVYFRLPPPYNEKQDQMIKERSYMKAYIQS